MSTLRTAFLFLLLATSLSAQLPDYFEFVDDWSEYHVLNVHPFQGGIIYVLRSDFMNRFDESRLIHVRADGSYYELTDYIGGFEDAKITSVGDSIVLIANVRSFQCDLDEGDFLWTYDGREVTSRIQLESWSEKIQFHPSGDSIYVFKWPYAKVFTSDGILNREIEFMELDEDFYLANFHWAGKFYGLNTQYDFVDMESGELLVHLKGGLLDYALFGKELVVISDSVFVISMEDKRILRKAARGEVSSTFQPSGRRITKVDDDYIFLSRMPDNSTLINFLKPDSSVETIRSDKNLVMEFVHYDGSHFYTGHQGRIIRKSKELITDFPYERTDIGIELLSAGKKSNGRKLFLSVALTNNSSDTIKKTTVWTSANGGPDDCGIYFFEFIVDKEILPSETIRVDTSTYLPAFMASELTVGAYGANNLWDNDLSDNTDTDFVNSVSSLLVEDISYYPNPTSDILNLELPTRGTYEVEIWNPQGLMVEALTLLASDSYSLNIQAYPKGLYLIKIWSESDSESPTLIKVLKQ